MFSIDHKDHDMIWDDIKRLLSGPTLFRLDTILSPHLVPILYLAGLASLLLWSVSHIFWRFGGGFGDGLWGVLEVVVFGLLGTILLRMLCEVLLIFFKAHEGPTDSVRQSRVPATLMEDVEEAIHDLANGDDSDDITPATEPAPHLGDEPVRLHRTARRTPRPQL